MTLIRMQVPPTINSEAMRHDLVSGISGEVRFDALSRALYSTDASVYQISPLGVVLPKSRADILHTLDVCRRYGCPITMRGGGTSQAGQSIGSGIQIDTSKYYNRILELNPEERWARVEPGIVLDELNARVQPLGLRFAPDISTASRATIGGMVANNSSGARSVLYGKTIDHVLELTVLLSDGSVVELRDVPRGECPSGVTLEAACYRTVLELASTHAAEIERRFPKILRRVSGYNLDEFTDSSKAVNLAKLIVGSEGTLGIILDMKLRLVPLPKAKAIMVIMFSDLLEALEAAPLILRHHPSAIEIMDKSILDHARDNPTLQRIRHKYLEGDPAATLCVEFYADDKQQLPAKLSGLEQDLRAHSLGYAYRPESELGGQAQMWSLREAALGLSTAMKGDAKSISFVEDTAVAPEKLRDYIERFQAIIRKHGTTAGIYAHASVGCLHVRPVINLKTEAGVRSFQQIAQEVADLVLEFGGTISGEHGDGLVRSPFLRQMFGEELYGAFRTIKQTFDPLGIFNPGKIIGAPAITSNLRFKADTKTPETLTWFDYSEYGGMGGAVEMCSGVGACRKRLSGTMCPSYMVTNEEIHSTRGRANALRLAMNGELEGADLSEEQVYEALDLCLECRACKTECPAGVDMASLKSEFLSKYWGSHGIPHRARVLANVEKLAKWGSRFAPLSNLIASSAPIRRISERLVDIDRRRSLPRWRRNTFARWVERNKRKPCPSGTPVVLFNDTFMNYYNPEIGIAALEVLEKGGCGVTVAHPGCCGRPFISQGLLAQAKAHAAKVVEGLLPAAEKGMKILVCEPSCLSAIKEDAPALLRSEAQEQARTVAAACQTFEEYAAGLALRFQPVAGRILVHGHCHQKSMGLLPAAIGLLSRIPSSGVVDLDAGCCGMAGSFGYRKRHYDVSHAIASRRLLPAVQSMNPGDVLVAPGVSCRHQIQDFGQAAAVHPAVLVRRLVQ
ncbi:MAG: FAD-binding and (Fe-S)-binding domain-containing protein [Bryobacteraceae bacterium]